MLKGTKKFIVASLVGTTLLAGGALTANAFTTNQDTNIHVTNDAFRPPLIGNIQGQTIVRTRNANNQAIRARMVITTSNSTTTSAWGTNQASSGTLARESEAWSPLVNGGARNGTARGDGQRRAASTGAWSTSVSASKSW